MDTIKKFLKSPEKFLSGEIPFEEISSLTIKRFMYQLNVWRIPIRRGDWWRVSFGLLVYAFSFADLISGFPLDFDIPNVGKFFDIGAGVEISFSKWLFLYLNRDQITDLINLVNERSLSLKTRADTDPEIKKMRNFFYTMEMAVFIFSFVFCVIFICVMFLQVMTLDPLELVVPTRMPFSLEPGSRNFWICHFAQFVVSMFVAICMITTDMMIGNLYNQVLLHLEVLHYDLRRLDEDESVSTRQLFNKFCEFSAEFQSLQRLNNVCEKCMHWFFINNVLATMVAVTFSCVEVGIMINVDITQCIKPFMYFLFLNIAFFYWCWLGNRLKDRSSGLALAAYIYKENASTVATQRLQLNFIHMVQSPLTIIARPFFELNFDIFVSVLKTSYKFTTVFKNFNDKVN